MTVTRIPATEEIQDTAAALFTTGTHSGISFAYDDANAKVNATVNGVTPNSQTGTAYTLVLADAGNAVDITNASANTLTVPTNASVAFPVGTVIEIAQLGAGQTTIAGSGVTFLSASGLKLRTQNAVATIRKNATNTWLVAGDTVV